ncbi:hypothetical protein AB0K68_54345 [Streptomyces sp. NPDC050698]
MGREQIRHCVTATVGEYRLSLFQKRRDTFTNVSLSTASIDSDALDAMRDHGVFDSQHAPDHLTRQGNRYRRGVTGQAVSERRRLPEKIFARTKLFDWFQML